MKKNVYIAGHKGMVGSSILRKVLFENNFSPLLKSRFELNLLDQDKTKKFLQDGNIDHVYIAAAKVGGILANSNYPADFIFENLLIQSNLINGSFEAGIKKIIFLGSSCIYPKFANQPITEEELLTGFLEKTNEPYSIAKIAGLKMCESYNRQYGKSHNINFFSLMPTNLYGTGDNYDSQNSHVLPALLKKIFLATKRKEKKVTIWGTGKPLREFMHVDDLAEASIFCMNLIEKKGQEFFKEIPYFLNVGTGEDISIENLAILISDIIGFKGSFIFDKTKPDGTPKKLLDSSRIKNLGWKPKISLEDGIRKTLKELEDKESKLS